MKARFRIELDLSRRRSSWIVPDPGRHPNIDFILAQEQLPDSGSDACPGEVSRDR